MAKVIFANEVFPISPNPQTGSYYLGVDPTDGHLKIQNSAGAVADYNSANVFDDADAVAAVAAAFNAAPIKTVLDDGDRILMRDVGGSYRTARKQAVLQRNVDLYHNVFTDFLGSVTGDFVSFVAGSGASAQSGTYGADATERAIGVTQVDTGTTSTGRAAIGLQTPATLRATLARYKFAARLALEALSTTTETFVFRAGLTDSYLGAGEGTNGIYFRYTDLQNGGRLEAVARAGGVDLTTVDTGFAPDLDYHVYEIDLNEAGSQALFMIDGATVATINAPLLPNVTQAFGCGYKIEKTIGSGQRNLSADWLYFELDRTNAR